MKLFRSIRRALARTSFAKIVPIVAFSIALVISAAFAVYSSYQAHAAHTRLAHSYSTGIAELVSKDVARGDLELADRRLSAILPGRAVIETKTGEVLAGSLSLQARRDVETFLLVDEGGAAVRVRIAPIVDYKPPVAMPLAVLLCIVTSLSVAMGVGVFSNLLSRYINHLTIAVNAFHLNSNYDVLQRNLVFSEFRALAVATVRTTRRMVRSIGDLRDRARYDPRTGLFNEMSLQRTVSTAIETARYDAPAALIVVDLSAVALDSDGRGGPSTEELAQQLKGLVRTGEARQSLPTGSWTLGAMHNDQYGILVKEISARDDLADLVRDIQRAFRANVEVDDAPQINISGSIVMIPEDADTVELAFQRAAATLQDLRRQEKRGFAFYSPKLERQREAQIKLEAELREAVKQDRFVPLFQPKIDLKTGEICGAEALARWRLDSGRLASPSVFIELAEETGLISAIGSQIMRKACQEAVLWTQLGHRLSIAVNVSPKQFERDGLSQMILDALADSGLTPRQLEIEITESLAIQQPERVRAVLTPLRKLGIKLAIDDFGTGHSNLATLTQFDFDVFKIDRQFVAETPDDPQANAIVEMIMSMAQTLGMTIVGEGIETKPQAKFLTGKGCHIGQGFLYSPPVTAEVFRKMLDEQPFAKTRLIA